MTARLTSIALFTGLFLALFFVAPSLVAVLTMTQAQLVLPLALALAVTTLWLLRRNPPTISLPRRHHLHKPTV